MERRLSLFHVGGVRIGNFAQSPDGGMKLIELFVDRHLRLVGHLFRLPLCVFSPLFVSVYWPFV